MPTRALNDAVDRLRDAARPIEGPDDGDCLARFVGSGDAVAFEGLVRRHGPMVLGVCRRLLRNPADADDAFQATFFVLARKAAVVRPATLAAWLHGVARHAALKARAAAVRRAARERQVTAMPEPASEAPAQTDDLREVLDAELERLPRAYRSAVILCDLEERGYEEAAKLLGWKLGTLSGRLTRARRMLAERLTRRGVALAGGLAALGSEAVPASLASSTAEAAGRFAAGAAVPGRAGALAEGVLQAMIRKKLRTTTLLAFGVLGAFAVGLALFAPAAQNERARPGDFDLQPVRQLVLEGHTDAVVGVRFSPDGQRIATASHDRTVRVWDVRSGKVLFEIRAHDGPVNAVDFSPDGRLLASGGDDGGVRLWEAASGRAARQIDGLGGPVYAVAFSPNGGRLAASGSGGSRAELKVWDVATGRESFSIVRDPNTNVAFWGLAFSPDGQRIAVGKFGREIHVIDVEFGREVLTLKGLGDPMRAVRFSPDGKRLVAVGVDKMLRVWDAATGEKVHVVRVRHTNWVNAIVFRPDGRLFATGGSDVRVKLWDAATAEEVFSFRDHEGNVEGLDFSPDGRLLATASRDKTAKVYALVRAAHGGAVGPRADDRPAEKKAEPAENGDPRQVASAFVASALAGNVEAAVALTKKGTISEKKVRELAAVGGKKLALRTVDAAEKEALAVSEEVAEPKRGEKGHLLFTLVRDGKRWVVKDIDFEDAERTKAKRAYFFEKFPEAKAVKD